MGGALSVLRLPVGLARSELGWEGLPGWGGAGGWEGEAAAVAESEGLRLCEVEGRCAEFEGGASLSMITWESTVRSDDAL